MTVISGGKVFDTCRQCGKLVQLNKMLFGSLHTCVSDCEKAGGHLSVREEIRGHLWWKRTWRVCDGCGKERKLAHRAAGERQD